MPFLFAYCLLWLLTMGYAARRLARRRDPPPAPPSALPRLSILVAARDEEANLPACLAALRALDYPADRLEILVGDDGSTDRTCAVAEAALAGFAGSWQVLTIRENLGSARGKANVLAHLARRATANYWLLTDADIRVPPTWARTLLGAAPPGGGMVIGLTVVQGPGGLARLQGLDWLLSLALLQVSTEAGRPLTAMGNNMLITRAAYEATGGYEALPATVVEDFALFRAVRARGIQGFTQLFGPAARAASAPAGTWAELLRQRRRWLRGVAALPAWVQGGLIFFSGYWAALAGLALLGHPGLALAAWGLKILATYALALAATRRAGLPRPGLSLVAALEVYSLALTTHLTLSRLLGPRGVEWKGRRYA